MGGDQEASGDFAGGDGREGVSRGSKGTLIIIGIMNGVEYNRMDSRNDLGRLVYSFKFFMPLSAHTDLGNLWGMFIAAVVVNIITIIEDPHQIPSERG